MTRCPSDDNQRVRVGDDAQNERNVVDPPHRPFKRRFGSAGGSARASLAGGTYSTDAARLRGRSESTGNAIGEDGARAQRTSVMPRWSSSRHPRRRGFQILENPRRTARGESSSHWASSDTSRTNDPSLAKESVNPPPLEIVVRGDVLAATIAVRVSAIYCFHHYVGHHLTDQDAKSGGQGECSCG